MSTEMTWNHRVIRKMEKEGEKLIPFYSIREVYYNSNGTIMAYTEHPIEIEEQSIESLRITLTRMLECLDTPVLNIEDIVCVDEWE